jgi:UDP-N-acetylmuramoylalanine--D-glutamate ligase
MGLKHAVLKIISYEDSNTYPKYKNDAVVVSHTGYTNADVYVKNETLVAYNKTVCDLSTLLDLRGVHNHQNAAFAFAACSSFGIASEEIAGHIASFRSLPHRMNIVRKIKNVLFVNDSKATNPDSAAKALSAYAKYKIFWLVGGRSKQIDPHQFIDQYMESVFKIYLFGESMDEFEKEFMGTKQTQRCETIGVALKNAYTEAISCTAQSVILFSPMCASFDQFENFSKRGEHFCKLVAELG